MKILILIPVFKKVLIHLLHKAASAKLFLFYFSRINKSNNGMVVSLHRTTATAPDNNSLNSFIEMTGANLEKTLVTLKKLGVEFIPLHQTDRLLSKTKAQPLVHLSFDDGYADTYTTAYPILKKHRIPFSVFPVTNFIDNESPFLWWYMAEQLIENKKAIAFDKYKFNIKADAYLSLSKEQIFERCRNFLMDHIDADATYFEEQLRTACKEISLAMPPTLTWQMINEMTGSGLCETGAHTKSHARFSKLGYEQQREEITASQNEIESSTGVRPQYFVYPYGDKNDIGATDRLQQLMEECGIKSAFTTIENEINTHTEKYLIPRLFINNSVTSYTLRTRLTGAYQRNALPGQ